MSRTQNSILNFITGIGSKILLIIMSFITRTVFIRTLGDSFLGIEGLFTNILSMLSLAELGFGSAIVYKLYRPIAENDRPRILVLLKLYRKTYFIVGCVIAVVGICLIPFLPNLVEDYYRFEQLGLNAVFIFLLYLFSTVSSYWFFAYKTAFVQANQKSYLLNIVEYIVFIASSVAQILALLLFEDFVLYLVVQILFSILASFMYASVCDRKYPYTKEKTTDRISKTELKEFFNDCSALLLYRASTIVENASASIVLSSILGLHAVALYTAYSSVKVYIRSLLNTFLTAIQASLGSIYTTGKLDWSRQIFRIVNFCSNMLYGIFAIGIAVLMDEFLTLWLGSSYVVTSWEAAGRTIATPIALLVAIEFFTTGQTTFCGSFRNAMGLFQELKYRPIASILVNLALCILTVPHLGIAGCMLSLIVANLTTNLIFDPIIIHKHALKESPRSYYLHNLSYKTALIATGLLAWRVCCLITLTGILGFIVRGALCVLVSGTILCLVFCGTEEFRYLINIIKSFLRKEK